MVGGADAVRMKDEYGEVCLLLIGGKAGRLFGAILSRSWMPLPRLMVNMRMERQMVRSDCASTSRSQYILRGGRVVWAAKCETWIAAFTRCIIDERLIPLKMMLLLCPLWHTVYIMLDVEEL